MYLAGFERGDERFKQTMQLSGNASGKCCQVATTHMRADALHCCLSSMDTFTASCLSERESHSTRFLLLPPQVCFRRESRGGAHRGLHPRSTLHISRYSDFLDTPSRSQNKPTAGGSSQPLKVRSASGQHSRPEICSLTGATLVPGRSG